jgi:hypothetical protein
LAAQGGESGVAAIGITSIIEAVVTSPEARTHIADIIDVIVEDERLRQASAQTKAAMKEQPMDPTRFAMPVEEMALRRYLLSMDPFNFEQHSMSFFHRAGLEAWATRTSNDFGVDGFAVHSDGLITVQCKRNSTENKVGRPTVQQFEGVVEEQNAHRGYRRSLIASNSRRSSLRRDARLTSVAMERDPLRLPTMVTLRNRSAGSF